MVSKVVVALCLMLAVASALPGQAAGGGWGGWGGGWGGWGGAAGAGGVVAGAAVPANPAANPWIPPWIYSAPWYPKWAGPCTTIENTCLDCNTKMVCTKVGGLQKACSDPTLPYCNLGECSATPSAECAPISAVPAPAAVV